MNESLEIHDYPCLPACLALAILQASDAWFAIRPFDCKGLKPYHVLQGLRIDYVLVSPNVLPDVGPCRIIDTPHKWSDHAALHVSIANLHPPPPHEPVAESSKKMKQFNKQGQRSIAAMFAGRASAPRPSQAGALPGVLAERDGTAGRSTDGFESGGLRPGASQFGGGSPTAEDVEEMRPERKRRKAESQRQAEAGPIQEVKPNLEQATPTDRSTIKLSKERELLLPQNQVDKKQASKEAAAKEPSTAVKKAEQMKRDKGQQGIRSFFAKPK